jgi:hypothetical protein
MTCIVGLVENDVVYMGGDSCGSNGWGSEAFAGPKVFKVGPFLIGYTTSFRMGHVLQHALRLNRQWVEEEIDVYMRTTFIECVRGAFKAAGWSTIKDGQEIGGEFLVGIQGRLFSVHEDYGVLEPLTKYTACGSGYLAAKGALAALEEATSGIGAVKKIQIALAAAEKHVSGVRGPFTVLEQTMK